MNLMPRINQDRLFRESSNRIAIACRECLDCLTTARAAVIGFASREHDTRRHSLQVPFPWSSDRLVEIIDIEYQAAIGCFITAEILHMRIAAKLNKNAGI